MWLTLTLVAFGLQGVNAAPPEKPNVIVFLMDDLGWNCLGYTGSKFYESPNIDRLAQKGVVFTRAYAAPICSPTRTSLMTGLDPARTGFTLPTGGDKLEVLKAHVQPRIYTPEELKTDWANLPGGMRTPPNQRALQVVSVSRLSTEYSSIFKIFKANGYRTAHFGKWHVGPEPYSALDHGADVDAPHANTPGPLAPGHFGPWPKWPGEEGPENKGRHIDDCLAEHAITFIQENKDRPFFINFCSYGVHIPWQGKKETIEHFLKKVASGVPGNAVHGAMVAHTDEAIGRVWKAVEEAGLEQKTIVVFLSDNGAGINLLQHPMLPEGGVPITDNAPLRGGKGDIYEGGVRIPGFVIWPGVSPAGTRCDLPINSRDVLPTIAEMCGIKELPKGDGRSFAPAVAGKKMEELPVFTHYPHYGNWSGGGAPATSVVFQGWKLIRFYFDGPNQKNRYELYHLAEDPGETLDHSLRKPELVAKLDKLIADYLQETGAVLPQPNPAYHEARKDAFEELAYQLFEPSIIRGGKYPMVVCLSGMAEDGTDHPEHDNPAFASLQRTSLQFQNPCFLLAVRCPKGAQWVDRSVAAGSYDPDKVPESDSLKKVAALVGKLVREEKIDPHRIYLTGAGLGGDGVWDLILRHPGVFAAAVPIGGTGSPVHAQRIKDLPVWAFEDAQSPGVAGSRDMIAALKAAGSSVVQYTEYAQDGMVLLDNLWRYPVVREGNLHKPVVAKWLFEQGQSSKKDISKNEPQKLPPNILFIAVDDLNTRINCYGGDIRAITPNIDRLAARGVRFNRAYCPAPMCNPSRIATLFGMHAATTGCYLQPAYPRHAPLLKDAASIPQQLRQHGYYAIGSGKIFHALGRDSVWADPESWDDYSPMFEIHRRVAAEPNNGFKQGELGLNWFDWGAITHPGTGDEAMWDFKNARWVAEQLGKKHEKPFFMAFGTEDPHVAWYVPQKYFDMYDLDKIPLPKVLENDLDDVPAAGRAIAGNDAIAHEFDPGRKRDFHKELVARGKWREAMRGYMAAATCADAAIGVVLDALAASPHADNTFIVLWGDNGWHFGEKGHWQKSTLWEEGARVPLIVVAPGVGRPGGVCPHPVSLVDIYPTLMELCGVPTPKGLDGNSLVPLLKNPAADWPHAALTTYHRGNNSVRKGDWNLIRYSDGSQELYNYAEDPLEWHNLAADPSRAAILAEMTRYLPATEAPNVPFDSAIQHERVDRQWPSSAK